MVVYGISKVYGIGIRNGICEVDVAKWMLVEMVPNCAAAAIGREGERELGY